MNNELKQVALDRELARLRELVAREMPDNPALAGWAAFSQCDEDGIVRECLARIGRTTALGRSFVEVGSADGLENNTHMLLLDGWRGVWIEGDEAKVRRVREALGTRASPALWPMCAFVSADTARAIALRCRRFAGEPSIDFLSLDIDGNDAHVLAPFVEALDPKLVCVEYNAKFPPPTRLTMRYDARHAWSGDDYYGASLQSWVDLLAAHEYALVCCNLSGANAFFVKRSLLAGFTERPPARLYQPARHWLVEGVKGHAPSLRWARQRIESDDAASWRAIEARIGDDARMSFAVHATRAEPVSEALAREGTWEPFGSGVFARLCRPGDTVLDLGAGIGWYAALAARAVGASGRVIACEPQGPDADLLEVNAALADVHGVVEIHRADGGPMALETLLAARRLPDVVRTDARGASGAGIPAGAAGLLESGWRPVLIVEHPTTGYAGGDDPLAHWRMLDELGYEPFELGEADPALVPATRERLQARLARDPAAPSGRTVRLLWLPAGSDRRASVADLIDRAAGEPGVALDWIVVGREAMRAVPAARDLELHGGALGRIAVGEGERALHVPVPAGAVRCELVMWKHPWSGVASIETRGAPRRVDLYGADGDYERLRIGRDAVEGLEAIVVRETGERCPASRGTEVIACRAVFAVPRRG